MAKAKCRGAPPSRIFRLNWGPKGRKKFFLRPPPLPYIRVWIRPLPPLSPPHSLPYLKVWIRHWLFDTFKCRLSSSRTTCTIIHPRYWDWNGPWRSFPRRRVGDKCEFCQERIAHYLLVSLMDPSFEVLEDRSRCQLFDNHSHVNWTYPLDRKVHIEQAKSSEFPGTLK